MKKIVLLFIVCVAFNSFSQSTLTYYTGFDTPTEQSGWTIFRKASASSYSWTIEQNGYSAAKCLAHYYPVVSSAPTDDWYVSPVFNFAGGGKIDSLRTNFSGFGTPGPSDTIGIYLFKGSNNPSQATSIIKLFAFQNSDYNKDGQWHLLSNVTIPAQSGNSYLAFKYYTTNNWLDVKFDNLRVKINSTVGVDDLVNEATDLVVGPHPASNFIKILTSAKEPNNGTLTLKVFNLLGEMVLNKQTPGDESLTFELNDGAYVYEIYDLNSKKIKNGKLIIKAQN